MASEEIHDPDVRAISGIGVQPILEVITQATGLRLSLIARVTVDDWKACAVHDALGFGLSVGQHLVVATTLCAEVRDARAPVLIEHASQDATYCDHPTPKMYSFESYISVPIFLADGSYFGNVCALDSKPLPLRARRAPEMMQAFAKLIGLQLDAQKTGELREQFIAVVGHDLRNPLNAMMMGAEALEQSTNLPEKERRIAARMHRSGKRMVRLLDDVVDFTRGRLGGGIIVEPVLITDLDAVMNQVVAEIQSAHADREIRVQQVDRGEVHGDRVRIGQLVSNLLANACQHGRAGTPIDVLVTHRPDQLELSVTNACDPIPADKLERLFEPYVRGKESTNTSGLGLGLYIASEIARSHGGKLTVTSNTDGTTFRCVLPRRP